MIFHSSFEYQYLWLPLLGFIVGFIGSLVGGGGGFFFLPVLILIFQISPQIAVPTSLAATIPICIAGSIGHYRHGNVDVRPGLIFAAAGIFGAITGAKLVNLMTTEQLKTAFGIYSILIATQLIIDTWKKNKAESAGILLPDRKRWKKFTLSTFFGYLSGIVSGTFGTTGNAPVMAGLFAMQMPLKIVLGTSLMIITFNMISAVGAHFLVGEVDLTLVSFLTAGTIVGALAGPKVLANIKIDKAEGPVRYWYAIGMMVFGILMIL